MSSSSSNAAARRRRAAPPPVAAQNAQRQGLPNSLTRAPPVISQQFSGGQNIRVISQQQPVQRPMPTPQQQPTPQQMPTPQQQPTPQQPARTPMTPAQMLISHENRINEIDSSFPEIIAQLSRNIEQVRVVATSKQAPTVDNAAFVKVAQLEEQMKQLDKRISDMASSYALLSSFATETNIAMMKLINSPAQSACACSGTCSVADTPVDNATSDTVINHSDNALVMTDVEELPSGYGNDDGVHLDIQPLMDEFNADVGSAFVGNEDDGNEDDGNEDDGNEDDGNEDDGNEDDGNADADDNNE